MAGHGAHDDMPGMGDMPMMHMSMKTYFHAQQDEQLLFEGWKPASGGAYFGTLVAIVAFALAKEWLFAYRKKLASGRKAMEPLATVADGEKQRKYVQHDTLAARAVDTVLYMLNLTLGYILMLVVMTYNIGYGLAVIVGCGIGYFAFGVLYADTEAPAHDCCETE